MTKKGFMFIPMVAFAAIAFIITAIIILSAAGDETRYVGQGAYNIFDSIFQQEKKYLYAERALYHSMELAVVSNSEQGYMSTSNCKSADFNYDFNWVMDGFQDSCIEQPMDCYPTSSTTAFYFSDQVNIHYRQYIEPYNLGHPDHLDDFQSINTILTDSIALTATSNQWTYSKFFATDHGSIAKQDQISFRGTPSFYQTLDYNLERDRVQIVSWARLLYNFIQNDLEDLKLSQPYDIEQRIETFNNGLANPMKYEITNTPFFQVGNPSCVSSSNPTCTYPTRCNVKNPDDCEDIVGYVVKGVQQCLFLPEYNNAENQPDCGGTFMCDDQSQVAQGSKCETIACNNPERASYTQPCDGLNGCAADEFYWEAGETESGCSNACRITTIPACGGEITCNEGQYWDGDECVDGCSNKVKDGNSCQNHNDCVSDYCNPSGICMSLKHNYKCVEADGHLSSPYQRIQVNFKVILQEHCSENEFVVCDEKGCRCEAGTCNTAAELTYPICGSNGCPADQAKWCDNDGSCSSCQDQCRVVGAPKCGGSFDKTITGIESQKYTSKPVVVNFGMNFILLDSETIPACGKVNT